MATTATGTPHGAPPSAARSRARRPPGTGRPRPISSWSLVRVKVALNSSDAVKAYAALRAEYQRRANGTGQ
jgi:hypothetical protein